MALPKEAKQAHRHKIRRLRKQLRQSRREGRENTIGLLSPRDMRKETNTLANLEYGPSERELGREQRSSDQQQRNISDWYGRYEQAVGAANTQINQAYEKGQQDMAARVDGQGQLAQQDMAQRQAESSKQANITGATVPEQSRAAQAMLARRALGDSYLAKMTQDKEAQVAYGANQTANVTAHEIGAHERESGRRREVDQSLQALKREKGQYKTKARGELREHDREFFLGTEALNVDRENAALDFREGMATLHAKVKQENREFQHKKLVDLWDKRRDDADYQRLLSRTNEQNADSQWRRNFIKNHGFDPLKGKGKNSSGGYKGPDSTKKDKNKPTAGERSNWRGIANGLTVLGRGGKIDPKKLPPLSRRAASEINNNGHVSQSTYKLLRESGYFVPKRYRPVPGYPGHY